MNDLHVLRKNIAYILSFSIILPLCITLFGCNSDGERTELDGVTFTDALGRTVTVTHHPERVAALLGSFADVWVLAGGELCAAADDAWEDFGLELDGAVNIGGAHSPSLELLISSKPEFVLASASTASNVKMLQTLEDMGITVAYFGVDCFDDYLAMLKICTDILMRDDLYVKNGCDIRTQIQTVKDRFDANVQSDEKRRVLLLRASSSSVKAKGSEGTILGEMLCDMGCINVADGSFTMLESLSVEGVIREDPYRIFVVTMGNDTDKAKDMLYGMLNNDPAWGTLDAVKNGRLHIMDKELFNLKPNDRWAESYEKLYEILTEE